MTNPRLLDSGLNWDLRMLVFDERENQSTWRKTSRRKERTKKLNQHTVYDAGSGNQTQDTLVGGEHSHH